MKEIEFPAIFHVAEEGGYWVEFPDLGIFTQGDDLEEAINMAGDCLLCYADEIKEDTKVTPIENIVLAEGEYVKLIKPKYYKSDK
jgi:predicted RNase H-like HicB family nuclease